MKEENKKTVEETEDIKSVEKPIIPYEVALEDAKDAIIKILNASGLPVCIITNMLSDITSQYNVIAKEITYKKREEYNQKLIEWQNSQKDKLQ